MEKEFITSHLIMAIIFALIGGITNYFAYIKNFFTLPSDTPRGPQISVKQLFVVFVIYIGISIIITPFIVKFIHIIWVRLALSQEHEPIVLMTIAQVSNFALTYFLLYVFSMKQDKESMKLLWKDPSGDKPTTIGFDMSLGAMTWILSFPTIILINQLGELFIYWVFGLKGFPQVAVQYLQRSLASPLYFVIALITIIILAPILEEYIFRGFLQSWFKKHFGSKPAILLPAVCFALFHFAPSQGVSNFPLIFSLFVFALYLGFVYERQRSLFAPIALHMTFNAVSVLRIVFINSGT